MIPRITNATGLIKLCSQQKKPYTVAEIHVHEEPLVARKFPTSRCFRAKQNTLWIIVPDINQTEFDLLMIL